MSEFGRQAKTSNQKVTQAKKSWNEIAWNKNKGNIGSSRHTFSSVDGWCFKMLQERAYRKRNIKARDKRTEAKGGWNFQGNFPTLNYYHFNRYGFNRW